MEMVIHTVLPVPDAMMYSENLMEMKNPNRKIE